MHVTPMKRRVQKEDYMSTMSTGFCVGERDVRGSRGWCELRIMRIEDSVN